MDDPTDLRKKLGYILGFRKTFYEFDNIPSDGKIIFSESLVQYNSIRYAYIVLDDFQSNGYDNVYASDITYSGCKKVAATSGKIIAKLDYSRDSNGSGDDRLQDTKAIRNYHGRVDLNRFKVSLIDEFGRQLDIQNGDWSVSITIDQEQY